MQDGAQRAISLSELSHQIIKASLRVHTELGPGLLESAYQACLVYELRKSGLEVRSEVPLPVIYDRVSLNIGYRIDLLVENEIIIEIKAIERVAPVHKAQLLSYLRLSKRKVGLLRNFQCNPPSRRHSSCSERS